MFAATKNVGDIIIKGKKQKLGFAQYVIEKIYDCIP